MGMCRGPPSKTAVDKEFTLGNPPPTFKNRSSFTTDRRGQTQWTGNFKGGVKVQQQANSFTKAEKSKIMEPTPPKFEVHFSPAIANSAGCLRACRDAVFESSPNARIDFVSVSTTELTNKSSHIVITCVELDCIPLVRNGIAPCEIIRMEQRLMNSDNSTWCLAFRGLVALKSASRLTKLRQIQLSKLHSPDSAADDLQNLKPSTYVMSKNERQIRKKDPVKLVYTARKNPIFGFSSDDVRNSYHRQVDKLYKHYCPVKRSSVPMLMQQYHGREEYLLKKVKSKYCKPAPVTSTKAIYV